MQFPQLKNGKRNNRFNLEKSTMTHNLNSASPNYSLIWEVGVKAKQIKIQKEKSKIWRLNPQPKRVKGENQRSIDAHNYSVNKNTEIERRRRDLPGAISSAGSLRFKGGLGERNRGGRERGGRYL